MTKVPVTRILAISPEFEKSVDDLYINIIEGLNKVGLQYVHVGVGVNTVYIVLPRDVDQLKLNEVARSCNAVISGSGYLQLEKNQPLETVEQALKQRPINYDIPVVGTWDQMFGLCGDCGGVGRHYPPCIRELS